MSGLHSGNIYIYIDIDIDIDILLCRHYIHSAIVVLFLLKGESGWYIDCEDEFHYFCTSGTTWRKVDPQSFRAAQGTVQVISASRFILSTDYLLMSSTLPPPPPSSSSSSSSSS